MTSPTYKVPQVPPGNPESFCPEGGAPTSPRTAGVAVHPPVDEKGSKGSDPNQYLVTFEGEDDPYCPLNWSFKKKSFTTMMYACCTFGPQFSSSVYGPVIGDVATLYNVSTEVATLGVSLFLIGVGFGPMVFAPVSEVYGRKIGVIVPFFISGLFAIGCATASNLQTVLIMRFFQGLFGGAPVSNSGGVLGDIWRPEARGIALVCYSFVVAGGPTIAPLIGASLSVSGDNGWRWTSYLCAAYTFVVAIISAITVPETYHPVLLSKKAKTMRTATQNWAWHSRHDEWDLTFSEIVTKHMARPFAMLLTPIVAAMCTYAAFAFGILYLGVIAIPVEFRIVRGWKEVPSCLPALGMFVGILIGGFMNIYFGRRYARVLLANNGKPIPEERLKATRIGCFLMPLGLFIFGWTSNPKYPWIAPVSGTTVMTIGFFTIFQGCLNYLVDAFLRFSASAIAATTFARSCFAAAFPLFGDIMFNNLGVPWGSSLVGFVAVAMIPIPFVFYRFGPEIRKRNPYSSQVM
ncbi:major facilitator superfamily domain-containing protein [Lipomyces tetrasporus]|uniref:Major facilitator superfamily domain-containing protein n=1 Tax=Lipomyces tetrasporus TaxID=54092 RepID=A0AAD7QYK8_9ASCO|nr:major facilitator superfamily domain-containing protein [Lipomyces tetrasporus]KAJ8103842.1 major facilitator superfamily domain-containing protein [Lipomyces tetrasporus]